MQDSYVRGQSVKIGQEEEKKTVRTAYYNSCESDFSKVSLINNSGKHKRVSGLSLKEEKKRIALARSFTPKGRRVPEMKPYDLIKKAIDEWGDNLCVSCSFGSCSVVVLHMALQIDSSIKVIFNNTGVEYPETYKYRDLLKREWNLNLIETKPIKSFWQCIREYGWPMIRRQYYHIKPENRRQNYQWRTGKPACCDFLKEKPFRLACKKYDIKATLTGLRCAESRARMYAIADWGQYYYAKKQKIWKYHPIAFWTHLQVREYFAENNIPMNEVYTKYGLPRSGCQPCVGFKGWEERLALTNPKMYRFVQHQRGQGLLIDYVELQEKIDECKYATEEL